MEKSKRKKSHWPFVVVFVETSAAKVYSYLNLILDEFRAQENEMKAKDLPEEQYDAGLT